MSHYGKCKHGIYLIGCRECFPLPELTKVGEELIQELVECFNEDKEMTANELADELQELDSKLHLINLFKAATMLRQQAKEIAMLKQIIDANNLQLNIGQLKKELALQRLSDFSQEIEDRESAIYATGYWKGIEYKKMRELSNEEINKLWAESHEDGIAMQQGFTTQQHYFAHLILRKASEK